MATAQAPTSGNPTTIHDFVYEHVVPQMPFRQRVAERVADFKLKDIFKRKAKSEPTAKSVSTPAQVNIAAESVLGPKEDRINSGRQELVNYLNAESPDMTRAFERMSEQQRNIGRLVGKLLNVKGYPDIEACWDWYRLEHNGGIDLTMREKCLVMFQVAESLDIQNPAVYRGIRKIFLQMIQND